MKIGWMFFTPFLLLGFFMLSAAEWEDITYDNFGGGIGNFKRTLEASNNKDVYMVKKDYDRLVNSNCIRLRDGNNKDSSIWHKDWHDVSKYTNLRVVFDILYYQGFQSTTFEEYEGRRAALIVKYRSGPDDWFVMDRLRRKNLTEGVVVDFNETGKEYNITRRAKILFECSGMSNDDKIYIDNIRFQGWLP